MDCSLIKPNGTKTWRYRFELLVGEIRKEETFTIGEYGVSPPGETLEQTKSRHGGGVFTLAEAREKRSRARALVKQGVSPVRNRETAKLMPLEPREARGCMKWGSIPTGLKGNLCMLTKIMCVEHTTMQIISLIEQR